MNNFLGFLPLKVGVNLLVSMHLVKIKNCYYLRTVIVKINFVTILDSSVQ